jgi:hypothetical protein
MSTFTDSAAEAREREWQERHKPENKHPDDYSSDEENEPAPAIEPPAPPQQPPADFRYPQAQGFEGRPLPAFEGRPAPGFEGRTPPDPAALAGYATEV